MHWRFESIDIRSYLVPGNNIIAAVIWNFGKYQSVFQLSLETTFLFQVNDSRYNNLKTGQSGWKVLKNQACHPIPTQSPGDITVDLKKQNKTLKGMVKLPSRLGGKIYLEGNRNRIGEW